MSADAPWYQYIGHGLFVFGGALVEALNNGLLIRALVFFGIVVFARICYKLQRKLGNGIDFADMIITNGKVDPVKVGITTALVVSTWVVILYAWRGVASTELVLAYIGVWTGTQISNRWIAKNEAPAPLQPATITVTANADQIGNATASATSDGGIKAEIKS